MNRDTRVLKLVYRHQIGLSSFKAWVRSVANVGGKGLKPLAQRWLKRKGLKS